MNDATQPALFEPNADDRQKESVVLFALGDFQSRGKVLADRELALDRLGGALRRATAKFAVGDLSDDAFAAILERLGAKVKKVPSFVAKHPYRVTVPSELADRARRMFGDDRLSEDQIV